ncbi:MAG: YggS family pyridoxal phosphate-dependent enzyme [Clostridiales bacterium]|jgi:pyridoxal phosphate enzyme (YggS family)|nr:YggS family pyridoxal phosphate-dependent enzyme [Clostridiales bacterium]
MDIQKNIAEIKANIAEACKAAGRNPDEVIITAAVKTQTKETVCGLSGLISDVGENRVQEFLGHYDAGLPFRWHFIGRLQTNKIKYLIGGGKNVLIHSLDRAGLAEEIDAVSKRRGVVTECLVEVNIGGEESKGGISPDCTAGFIASLAEYKNIKIKGLMSVMPNADGERLAEYYKTLRALFDETKTAGGPNVDCVYLSAGMSNDYIAAIKYGANIVRLGTAIFGARSYAT